MATDSQISTDASAWPYQLYLLCTTSGRTDTCLLVQKSVSTRLLSSLSYYMQQKPGTLLLPTSKLWKPSTWSVSDSSCRSAGNSFSEMTRSQWLPACHRYRKSSAAVVAPSLVMSRDYHKMSRHTRPSTAASTCLSTDHPTTSGNAAPADPESDGSTKSKRTMGSPGGPVEACDYSWSPRSNATALAGYVITTRSSLSTFNLHKVHSFILCCVHCTML